LESCDGLRVRGARSRFLMPTTVCIAVWSDYRAAAPRGASTHRSAP
jgi:hypothetical protein